MNIVLWGIGNNAHRFLSQTGLYQKDKIVALIDIDSNKWGKKIKDFVIQAPQKLEGVCYDKIIICPSNFDEIKEVLLKEYNIDGQKIDSLNYFYKKLISSLKLKYENIHDTELKSMIEDFEQNGPSVWGNYKGKEDYYPVYRDEEKYPYIMFMGKRMYFPYNYHFYVGGEGEYIRNILWEQGEKSPHLYIRSEDEKRIFNDGVIVDAGVREGNFALQYVEQAKKIYLIESDQEWMKALERTFRPFKDKVVLCDKLLSKETDSAHMCLDTLISEKIDFLKMDIEGSEVDAILGGKKVLSQSNAACAICSYHNMSDKENICFLMNSLGYKTTVSKGYMFFLYDPYLLDHLDFRRGIVYALKEDRGHMNA